MKLLSLFSGIGAFEKALTLNGMDYELVNYCEIDKYVVASLNSLTMLQSHTLANAEKIRCCGGTFFEKNKYLFFLSV